LPQAEAAGLVKKVSTRFEFPDGTKAFEKAINAHPEKFWTKDLLDKLDAYIQTQFKYLSEEPKDDDEDKEAEA
jgi:hypothetical protein